MKYCPVSQLINTSVDGLHPYPYDLYTISNMKYDVDLIRCDSHSKSASIHTCPLQLKECPIQQENIEDAIYQTNYLHIKPYYLCALSSKLNDPNATIVILLFGGSVTCGHLAQGCTCNKEKEPLCKQFNLKDLTESPTKELLTTDATYCQWSMYFKKWLYSISLAKIVFLNYCMPASNVAAVSPNLLLLMQKNGFNYSSFDLALIDYSPNDAFHLWKRRGYYEIQVGMEEMVRKLLMLNEIKHDLHERISQGQGAVILLEMYPYSSYLNKTRLSAHPVQFDDNDYARIYHNLAKHYNIPIWSYRDVVWSDHIQTNQHKLYDIINFNNNEGTAENLHPPWHVHLFYADLLTSIMIKEMDRCNDTTATTTASKNTIDHKLTVRSKTTLPDRLFKPSMNASCDESFSRNPLLSMSSNDALHGKLMNNIGSLASSSDGTWRLYEDRPGKSGWISEFSNRSAVSNGSEVHNLTFYTSPLSNFVNISSGILREDYALHVDYLSTYANAGKIKIMICGEQVGVIDSLWRDFKNYRVSTISHTIIPLKLMKTCHNIINSTVDYSQSHEVIGISFIHQNKPECTFSPVCAQRSQSRLNQKFKLIELSLCVTLPPR
eukprot:gene6493-8927_t